MTLDTRPSQHAPELRAAARHMGTRTRNAYLPIAHNAAAYDRLYREYVAAYDWFGRGNDMMRRLRRIATPEPVGAIR